MLAKITTKGQITLPKKIRDHLNVKAGDQLDFSVDDQGGVANADRGHCQRTKGHFAETAPSGFAG